MTSIKSRALERRANAVETTPWISCSDQLRLRGPDIRVLGPALAATKVRLATGCREQSLEEGLLPAAITSLAHAEQDQSRDPMLDRLTVTP